MKQAHTLLHSQWKKYGTIHIVAVIGKGELTAEMTPILVQSNPLEDTVPVV